MSEAETNPEHSGPVGRLHRLVPPLLALLALFAVALHRPFSAPIIRDNQHYFYMSERVASGVPLHVSHFDSKQGLSMLLTGWSMRAARALGLGDVAGARALSGAVFLLSVLLMFRVTLATTGSAPAALFAALLLVTFTPLVKEVAIGAQPKVFLLFFVLLALALADTRHPFAASLAATLAFLTWQPALLFPALLFLTHVVAGTWKRTWPRLLAGFLLPLLVYEFYFLLRGALRTQLEHTYYFPAFFMANNFPGIVESFLGLAREWRYGPGRLNPLPLLALGGVLLAAVRWVRSDERVLALVRRRPRLFYLVAAGLATLAFTYYDHQGPQDHFFFLPFLALISGWFLAECLAWFQRRRPAGGTVFIVGVSLFLSFLLVRGALHFDPPFTLRGQRLLAERVGEDLRAGRTVYAIGATHLLALNRAENWLPYGFFFRGTEEYLAERTGRAVFSPEREGRWPDILLVGRRLPEGAEAWLPHRYREETPPLYALQRVQRFVKSPDPAAAAAPDDN